MLSVPSDIGYILGLMLTAQAIERITDHAVNIAEDVVYMVEGEGIRHVQAEELKDLNSEPIRAITKQSKTGKRNKREGNRKKS